MEATPSHLECSEGYDRDFVPTPDSKYECPICLLILREPWQTVCGHRFCRGCITRWLNENEVCRCPVDNEAIKKTQLYPDNFAKREILSLSVRCSNAKHGCEAVVVLGRIEEHEGDCPLGYQPCPLDCPSILFRKDVEQHVAMSCENRSVLCRHCQQSVLARCLQEHEQDVCPRVTISCQHCQLSLLREQMQSHHDKDCPSVKVKCVFSVWGCDTEVPRREQASHQEESATLHLTLLSSAFWRYCLLQRIPPESLVTPRSPEGTTSTDLTAAMAQLSLLMQQQKIPEAAECATATSVNMSQASCGSGRQSLPIVGHVSAPVALPQAQIQPQNVVRSSSMSAAVRPPASEHTTSTSTSVRENVLHFTSGHSQDNGEPYVVASEFTSLKHMNVLQDESLARHDQHILELQSKINVLENSNKECRDRVHFLEEKLSFYSTMESRACNGNFLWRVKNFSRLRREAQMGETTVLHSPSFYSSLYGYKMCVRVNLNGVDSARGTHMSIFVHFMQGEFDDVLEWPFAGKIILSVLDQNPVCEIRNHIVETLTAKPNLAAFQRPLTQRNHKGFGYMEFVPLHILDNSSYVFGDVLIIRAQIIPNSAVG